MIELKTIGRRFTWANNQDNLIMSTIDRVFISMSWEMLFHVVQMKTLPRVGTDHTPLVTDTGVILPPRSKQFRSFYES